MKRILSAISGTGLLLGVLTGCSRTDLGQLQIVPSTTSVTASYAHYVITARDPATGDGYNVGDSICIECCPLRNPNPWPPASGVNNLCPKKIEFESTDGTVEYEADFALVNGLTLTTCTSCARNEYYKCPNP